MLNTFLISSAIVAWATIMYLLIPKLEEIWILYVLKMPRPQTKDEIKLNAIQEVLNTKIELLKDRIEELQAERDRFKREAETAWSKILDSIGQV